jgi:hypothetical protein
MAQLPLFEDDMAFDYAVTQATADRLIANFGRSMILRRNIDGVYENETGAVRTTTQDWAIIGVKLDYQLADIDGTYIKISDQRIFVAPSFATVPRPNDLIIIDLEEWTVVRVETLKPADVVLLHEVQVRK